MSEQMTITLSDDVVIALDDLVRQGAAPSRSALVEQAITREIRFRRCAQEFTILSAAQAKQSDADLDALAGWAGRSFRMDD